MAGIGSDHGGTFGGVSLASFLQMLEQEKKSCTLTVSSHGTAGHFYFNSGALVDADFLGETGENAVYAMLHLKRPSFRMGDAQERPSRISSPLAHLLLNAATKKDELDAQGEKAEMVTESTATDDNSAMQRLKDTILSISGLHQYYLLNRQGKMIAQSSKNRKMADFITYCIVSGIQIRKAMGAKGPHRIRIDLDNGQMLLIIPRAGMIIGLLLDENVSVAEVAATLRSAFVKQ
jgi:hypothetical protein